MTRFKVLTEADGLALKDTFSEQRPLKVDFRQLESRLKQAGRKSELIVQAVKPRSGLKVLDCTAGLGTDAFILAYLGCEVTLVERSRVLATLLNDGLTRVRQDADLAEAVTRLKLVCGDAKSVLATTADLDVVYLDPMFPVKSGSALVKGEMQILQRLLGPDLDSSELLECALASNTKKVVLKRPPKDKSWQPPQPPSHVVSSRNSRFEIYLT